MWKNKLTFCSAITKHGIIIKLRKRNKTRTSHHGIIHYKTPQGRMGEEKTTKF